MRVNERCEANELWETETRFYETARRCLEELAHIARCRDLTPEELIRRNAAYRVLEN